jgi:hydrogenase maturation protease
MSGGDGAGGGGGRGGRGRTVVAGVGNIFLSDDGFGAEVARRLARRALPAAVEVADVGIRSVHLAFDLLDGCDLLILADAARRGERPGR